MSEICTWDALTVELGHLYKMIVSCVATRSTQIHALFFSLIKMENEQMEIEHLYFRNDPTLPIYSILSSSYSASDLCDRLLSDDLNAYRLQPLGVTDNASFVIDLDCV